MMLSGLIPKDFNAGGKTDCEPLIQMEAPAFCMIEASIAAMKPKVAVASSALSASSSCMAPNGKAAFGKAFFRATGIASRARVFNELLYPCKGRISFFNWAIICAFAVSTDRMLNILGQKY